MDFVIPLNLNHNKKNVQQSMENSSSNEPSSPTKPQVLGREQAKKRLLAFAQQWNRTKDLISDDKALYKVPNSNGTLKYTYIVQGEHGEELSFPAHLIRYTKTHPPISYCENPHYAKGVYQSRREVLDIVDEETKRVMYFIMNSSSPSCQNREFVGRYRKWYTNKKSFIGRHTDDAKEEKETYSPHWESDSDDELTNYPDPTNPFTPIFVKPQDVKIVSKIKINQVELPFFDDDDFLEGLVESTTEKSTRIKQLKASGNHRSEAANVQKECSTFQTSPGKSEETEEKEIAGKEIPSGFLEDLLEPSFASDDIESRGVKRRAPTPDWDEQWRSTMAKNRIKRFNGTRPRSPPSPSLENNTMLTSLTYVKDEPSWKTEKHSDDGNSDSRDFESKRISLDERLELELGIKTEPSEPLNISQTSPSSNDRHLTELVSVRRRPGFGPKAAPMGAVVFSCPKALPPVPYIPPHMLSLISLPLVRTVSPAQDVLTSLTTEEDSNNEPISSTPTTPEQKKRDWDKELKNLEVIASNLEGADEKILQSLEEQLLQFEASLLPSGNGPPSPALESLNGDVKKLTKRPKRPKTPPITLKEPGKGILVMPRISLLNDGDSANKKSVVFADSVRPGYGTSSEDEDERPRSPVLLQTQLPQVPVPEAVPKRKKLSKTKSDGRDFDPVYDLLPAPPPPPGSPPPHLPQGRDIPLDPSSPTSVSAVPTLSPAGDLPPGVELEAS